MIHSEELRIGNRIFWKAKFSAIEILIQVEVMTIFHDKVGYIRSHLEHRVEPFEDNVITTEKPLTSLEEFIPIPLTENNLKKLDIKNDYPAWIQYLHELQNWFYWNNGKIELEINE